MFDMHSDETRSNALLLVKLGLNDCEIGRRIGLPRSTVREWRHRGTRLAGACRRCGFPTRAPMHYLDSDYAELLGLYLGDGHIVRAGRTQRLRLFLDTRYSGIIDDARSLLARSFPRNAVGMARSRRGTTTILSVYNSHLSCVFPQHGPGAKHKRAITLEEWQQNAVHAAPWAFIRGCIRSDGCAFVNRTGRYAYLSYEFRNYSRDILMLFAEACDEVGVKYRVYTTRVRMCQRPSVALLSENVGLKS